MRFFPLLVSLLPLGVLGAKKPTDPFQDFHNKPSPMKLVDVTYDRLTSAPRDYTVAVLLTALEARFGCELCRLFQPEWELLAKSWRKGDSSGESRLLFGTLDFIDGKATFQSLNLQTAPVLLIFHPTIGPDAKVDPQPTRFDFNAGPQTAESVHAILSRHLPSGPHPPVRRPVNYVKIVVITTAVLGLITLFAVAAPYLLPIIQNRNLWAAISLVLVLVFTSGQMFNHIRKVPYVAGNGKGGISYFAGGFQSQFGLETQIIAGIYGMLAFATITLALKVPRTADPKRQQVAVFIWSGILFLVYSFLLSVFRMKNSGYPFTLPPF
ncbi:putative dolichyl-diphosphooligosaccharide-protein glycotransferase [Eremomyces bilateralis CBS 781.70]|uniref:Dolichyl-diphosphooligosaccharide-protein glycotransferase n=1 Tax=Eremomyces bilateralis CBS 781.70 TaxID=1392243 RepID=A0A6G1FTG9_9PEZI|nr:putative dolichyl-diphosphooligosaccharide-protein glycotransferase [Eremomyces bilateralis CBS 781.70]KAF1809008.1 putative dolichyl-diphosphooligosaccharide-protein glycotransferase [Eremomyces bilateralis CBS 781.70]